MNTADVRKAMHIPDYAPEWTMCFNDTVYTYQLAQEASLWIYPILKMNGIKMMHYSGDTDGAVPTFGTKRWIEKLNWETKVDWMQWKTDGQVSGFVEQYDGLDFVTIKGVGHMAPQWAKKPVWTMINGWVQNGGSF